MQILEYKSNAHPDSLVDIVVENCASFLDSFYLTKYGKVLHYNVDKALLLAGDCNIYFGGGDIIKSPEFILGGQISNLTDELKMGLKNIIKATIFNILPLLPHINITIKSNNVAKNLSFLCENKHILANDTSFGTGFWPFNKEEQKVIDLKEKINETIKNQKFPIGQLYKIMNVGKNIFLSAPLFSKHIKSESKYLAIKNQIEKYFNVMFNPDTKAGSYYMTLCGSSIECGDDGQVGRGNRYNGLITPCRPMTLEAYHGKNNRNHTGKLYSKKAQETAKKIYKATNRGVEVILISQIGKPVNSPITMIKFEGETKFHYFNENKANLDVCPNR